MPPIPNIVVGQPVSDVKVERAKQLRQAMTPEEKVLWARLRGNRLEGYHFRRQQVIDGFIVDFYCHAAGVVVEIDGTIHESQQEADSERDQLLRSHNLLVLRLSNDEVNTRLTEALQRIAQACRERSE